MLSKSNAEWIDNTIEKIVNKMEWLSEKSQDKIPYTTVDGVHDDRSASGDWTLDNGLNWWTNGFWGGMLWQMYNLTGNKRYADIAMRSEIKLDQCFNDFYGLHHDVGFMWLPTAVANYRLTQNPESRKRGLLAAQLLAGRYNANGQFIRAWNDIPGSDKDTRGWAIIDCLFNIPLLYWASEETKDPRFSAIAINHANTVMKHFVRPDGSVHHIVEFDPNDGHFVRAYGGQGYADGSSWTRGQTWAMYGFIMSYLHTKDQAYLDTAKRIAHYFIANIPESGIIPVDFRQPDEPRLEDSTAAAIAACGFIELAKIVDEHEKNSYLNAAVKLLKTLDEKRCDWSHENDNILTHCTAAYHDQKHHFSIIYGDYFFIEALLKLKEKDLYIW